MAKSMGPILAGVFGDALAAVDPAASVRANVAIEAGRFRCGPVDVPLDGPGRLIVLAFGKAAPAMVSGLTAATPGAAWEGLAVTTARRRCAVPVIVAGHPEPDAASVDAGRRTLALAEAAEPDDLVVFLVSGGGSALLEAPAGDLALGDLVATNRALLRSGADIRAVNTVRKHLSLVKGGRLAAAAGRARLLTLVLSDVVGDPLDVIASGPTVADPTTYRDALDVLDGFRIRAQVPDAVVAHLERGDSGDVAETPKQAHPRQEIVLVGSGRVAAAAAVDSARARGYPARIATTTLAGEAQVAARAAVDAVRESGEVVAFAGETTVTVRGDGRGGRNQEAALAAAIEIQGKDITMLAAGTDGIDGPTDAAGAIVDGGTVARGSARGLDAVGSLRRNDAYPFLEAAGDLLVTGPTGTNVADLWLVVRG